MNQIAVCDLRIEIRRVQGETGVRPTVTRLMEDELHEAQEVVRRLAGKPRSLWFYVDFALANYREPGCQKSLVEAAAEYVAAKKHEFEQDLISDSYFVRLEREMERVPKRIPIATVPELTSARLVAYFEFQRASRKTYNNRRGTPSLHSADHSGVFPILAPPDQSKHACEDLPRFHGGPLRLG